MTLSGGGVLDSWLWSQTQVPHSHPAACKLDRIIYDLKYLYLLGWNYSNVDSEVGKGLSTSLLIWAVKQGFGRIEVDIFLHNACVDSSKFIHLHIPAHPKLYSVGSSPGLGMISTESPL